MKIGDYVGFGALILCKYGTNDTKLRQLIKTFVTLKRATDYADDGSAGIVPTVIDATPNYAIDVMNGLHSSMAIGKVIDIPTIDPGIVKSLYGDNSSLTNWVTVKFLHPDCDKKSIVVYITLPTQYFYDPTVFLRDVDEPELPQLHPEVLTDRAGLDGESLSIFISDYIFTHTDSNYDESYVERTLNDAIVLTEYDDVVFVRNIITPLTIKDGTLIPPISLYGRVLHSSLPSITFADLCNSDNWVTTLDFETSNAVYQIHPMSVVQWAHGVESCATSDDSRVNSRSPQSFRKIEAFTGDRVTVVDRNNAGIRSTAVVYDGFPTDIAEARKYGDTAAVFAKAAMFTPILSEYDGYPNGAGDLFAAIPAGTLSNRTRGKWRDRLSEVFKLSESAARSAFDFIVSDSTKCTIDYDVAMVTFNGAPELHQPVSSLVDGANLTHLSGWGKPTFEGTDRHVYADRNDGKSYRWVNDEWQVMGSHDAESPTQSAPESNPSPMQNMMYGLLMSKLFTK